VKKNKAFQRCLWAIVTVFLCIIGGMMPEALLAQSLEVSPQPQALVEQGKQLYEAGQFSAALSILEQAVQRYEAEGDRLQQALTLSNLALVYQQLGQLTPANQAIQSSLALLQSALLQSSEDTNTKSVLAQTLDIQGELQLESGQPEQALETWQQAETLHAQLNEAEGMTRSRINQAEALQTLGFYRRAVTLLSELSQSLQTQPDSPLKAIGLRSLGNTLQLTGDLEQSRQALQASLAVAQHLQLSPEISATLLSLGNTATTQQDWQAAIAFYQQVAQQTTDPLTQVRAKVNLLPLLFRTQQAPAAEAIIAQLPSQMATLVPSQASLYAALQLAQTLIDQQKIQPATELLAVTIAQARELNDLRSLSYGLGTLGGLYERTQQWSEAQALTQQALDLTQSISAPEIAYRWNWQMGRLLRRQGDQPGAIVAYDEAVENLQLLRKDLVAVNREVQFSFRDSVEPVYRESVAVLLESEQPNQQILDKARQRIELLQLVELDNFFREACIDAQSVILDEVVDRDNPETAIIYPILLPDRLQVITKIPQQPLRQHSIPRSRPEVETKLQQLREYLTEPDRTSEVKALSQEIYQWLIAPIASDLQPVHTLVFVLDGAFRSVPMAALYDGKNYLIEQYAIALSPGLQLLEPQVIANQRLRVLAAGLVQPPANFPTFPSLPAIPSEFKAIGQAGINTTQLLNQDFTQRSLEQKIKTTDFNVIHMATHGQFSSRAEETFVLAADGPINVTQFDTLLRQQNATQPLELLVLSACQTAAGDNRATLGLAGAAVRAGARSTLASLWNVGDRSTAILMGEFYRELAQTKVTKAEALRRAQITLLKKYPNYSRPNYWAPYVLIGNWL
jgi:CHAT domain-containing protein/predicted negative regulator of RcsB-dependent stress response